MRENFIMRYLASVGFTLAARFIDSNHLKICIRTNYGINFELKIVANTPFLSSERAGRCDSMKNTEV